MRSIFFLGCTICIVSVAAAQGSRNDFYISNAGNDANRGTTMTTPKKTISGIVASLDSRVLPTTPVSIRFRRGDIFNESFNPDYTVRAFSYSDNAGDKRFAILNGSDVFDTGWSVTAGASPVYEQDIPLTGFTNFGINSVGSYSIVYVFEIDKSLEATAPVTARRLLSFAHSLQEAQNTPGSFYEPSTLYINPKKIYIHTSDGSSPNHNSRYRYEVTVRDRAINSTYQAGNDFQNLWIRGYGAGNGTITAGSNSSFNRMIFGPGAGLHQLGVRNGKVNNSLFLAAAKNIGGDALVFYDAQGEGRSNEIKNCIFLDHRACIYTHTSGNGYNHDYASLKIDNVIGFADSIDAGIFAAGGNTDSATINAAYSYNYITGLSFDTRLFTVKNSSFINARSGITFGGRKTLASINNCFVKLKYAGWQADGIGMRDSTNLLIANSIIHFQSSILSPDLTMAGSFISGGGVSSGLTNATGNIFICDVASTQYVIAATALVTSNGTTNDNWDNNVYILLKGNSIGWMINSDVNGVRSVKVNFEEWKRRTRQDAGSLFFDLRNDPRGLKAIFTDPDNGDYSLANTIEGNQVKQHRAGMVNPVSCFLKKPSYEQAVAIISNNGILTANACRNPCLQNNIRISNHLTSGVSENKKVQLQWDIEDESAIDHFEIVRSFGSSEFITIAYIPATGNANYTYADNNVVAGITYRYSLMVVSKLVEKCYSPVSIIKLDNGKPVNIYPNPSTGRIMIGLNDYTGPVKITIQNVMGVIVCSKDMTAYYGIPPRLDLSTLPKGYYWIKVQTDANTFAQGFVLQ